MIKKSGTKGGYDVFDLGGFKVLADATLEEASLKLFHMGVAAGRGGSE